MFPDGTISAAMKLFVATLTLFLCVSAPAQLLASEPGSTCEKCHMELDEGQPDTPTTLFKNDVHNREGLGCAGCHGGDPTSDDEEVAMSEEKGFIGAPDELEIPEFCSKCHSNPSFMKQFDPGLSTYQYSKYLTSVHGIRNAAHDRKTAQCVSCHTAHGIRAADDPKSTIYAQNVPNTCAGCHSDKDYMADYEIPTDQFADFSRSVHGIALLENGDMGAPACNDCHGNHGAVPPEVSSIDHVCGICHANNMDDFEASTHFEYFEMLKMPACETCHSNHRIERPTTEMLQGEKSVCKQCHDLDDGTGGIETAESMRNALDSLNMLMTQVNNKIDEADRKGLYVDNMLFSMRDARQKEYTARTAVHTFNLEKVTKISREGIELVLKTDGVTDDLLDSYVFRRKGLVVSVVLLCLLAGLLWMKARQADMRQQKQ